MARARVGRMVTKPFTVGTKGQRVGGGSRRGESNPGPADYESAALPLSYVGLDAGSVPRTTDADVRHCRRLAVEVVSGRLALAEAQRRAVAK
jgi:hypothetical protein